MYLFQIALVLPLGLYTDADSLTLNSCRWEHLIYQFGGHQELIKYVIIKGEVVYENKNTMSY